MDLKKYLKMYQTVDKAHGLKHINMVRKFAKELAEKYTPNDIELVDLAALLHDIGITKNREGHEKYGVEIVRKDKELAELLGPKKFSILLEAIAQHRASTGNPKSLVAKIISDADRSCDLNSRDMLRRAYMYGKEHFPELTHEQLIRRAVSHLKEKYGPGGMGRRVYFPETAKRIVAVINPIIKANKKEIEKILSLN